MAKQFTGKVETDIRDSTPDWGPFLQPQAPEGAPNVLWIIWDDVGYGAMDVFGGPIETPTMRRIADLGLRYSNFHTTALCSPTRSCFLTGRNATSNNMACITEATSGFPGFSGRVPFENGMVSEVLNERGWNTYLVGKWHLTPAEESDMSAWKGRWPLGRGFERFYGFLGAETDQWYPEITHDNHPEEPPATPDQGYHFSKDITDKAIRFIRDAKAVAPQKPFFLYYSPGCAHAPHHVFKEWADKYRGRFDQGYEAIRPAILARQKELGLLSPETELSEINPHGEPNISGPAGQPWPQLDWVRPWDSLSVDEKRLFARMAEVYAGFVSYTDDQVGRLIDFLEESGQLENTIIMVTSDNGASGEGGPNGSFNENKILNGQPDTVEANLAHIDELGGPTTYNHYNTGWAWAFDTPFPYWKRFAGYEGGLSDPLIVAWPGGIAAPVRSATSTATPWTWYRLSTPCSASRLRRCSRATPRARSRGAALPAPSATRTPRGARASFTGCWACGPCTGTDGWPIRSTRRSAGGRTTKRTSGSYTTSVRTDRSATTWPRTTPSCSRS